MLLFYIVIFFFWKKGLVGSGLWVRIGLFLGFMVFLLNIKESSVMMVFLYWGFLLVGFFGVRVLDGG